MAGRRLRGFPSGHLKPGMSRDDDQVVREYLRNIAGMGRDDGLDSGACCSGHDAEQSPPGSAMGRLKFLRGPPCSEAGPLEVSSFRPLQASRGLALF